MGSFDPLTEKQPIIIQIPDDHENHYRYIIKAVSDDRLVASALCSSGELEVCIQPGSMVKVTYIDKVALYVFFSPVLAFNDKPSTLTLGKPINCKRIQRRNFVRLNARLKVISNILDDDMHVSDQSFAAKTIDISGGGLLFGCDVELKVGQVLEATIYLNDNETVKAIGQVVRVIENSANSKEKYSVGFEYTNIKECDRDKIVRYILAQQRLLRVKGLL